MGALLALEPGNRFRARAYERAAGAILALPDVETLARAGQLTTVPGIGRALARTVEELVRTGGSEFLNRLRQRYPPGTVELSRVMSLGRVQAIHDALGVTTLADLRAACEAGRVRDVRGFGQSTERRLLARIDELAARREAVTLARAEAQGQGLRDHLDRHRAVAAVELAGAFRRRLETIERLDLVVASASPGAVAAHAARAPALVSASEVADGRFVLHQVGGLDAHVRVVPEAEFAPALVDATGSTAHTAALARRATAAGLTLDDRSLRRGGRPLAVPSEEALYRRLGLDFIPPELRTDELEAAVPSDLVQLEDLQGAVHCHTVWSDGKDTVEEMARAADALGLRYLTITDHSASANYAHGLDVGRLRRQWDEIARVQERVRVRLLRGTESDILRDGSLDFPDAILRKLDVVVASIHNRWKMDADQMTRRLVRAMRHPVFKIWGHALGRYVLSRPPFACHIDEVLDAIAQSRAVVELNGDPNRLDLAPEHIGAARRHGIRFVISADAHSTNAIRNLRWGVAMARRGGVRRGEVLNTLDADAFAAAVRPR
jgi:DNA polymerase (family 10)